MIYLVISGSAYSKTSYTVTASSKQEAIAIIEAVHPRGDWFARVLPTDHRSYVSVLGRG